MANRGEVRDGRQWNGKRWVPVIPAREKQPRGTYNRRGRLISPAPASTPGPVPASESEPSNRDKTGPYKPDQQSFTPPEQNPGETLNPYPTTLDEAYGSMRPEAYGMTRLGMQMGNINTKGFVEPTDGQTLMINQSFGGEINTDLGVDYTTGYVNTRNKGVYNLEDAGTEPVAWMHDTGDLGTSQTLVKNKNADAFQSMRGQEKDAGLIYASGKYWHEGENGKLEPITMGMTGDAGDITQDSLGRDVDKSGWTANRKQAMEFMRNKRGRVIEAQKEAPPRDEPLWGPPEEEEAPLRDEPLWGPPEEEEAPPRDEPLWGPPEEEEKAPPRDEPLWGDTPTPLDKTGPTRPQKPRSTKQTPSIPFGEIPEDLGGLIPRDLGGLIPRNLEGLNPRDLGGLIPRDLGGVKLPGGVNQMIDTAYDYGEGLAGDAGAWYGEKKGRERVGNAPLLGDIFGNIGKNKGRDRATKVYGETLGPLRDYFQQ